jgi:hypothetical protein
MKQWIVIVKSPSKYDLGRLDLNMRPLNYVALWTIGTIFYRYYEFLDHVTEKVLKNIFKLGDRVTISPVKIWERRHHLDDETISLSSFKEAGEMTELKYKVAQEKVEIVPKLGEIFCTNCRQYRSPDYFSKLKNGKPKKTCNYCCRKREQFDF